MNVFVALLGLASVAPVEPDWNALLAPARLNLEQAKLDQGVLRFYEGDSYVVPAFLSYWSEPFRIPMFAKSIQASLTASAKTPSEVLSSGGRLLGVGTRRTLIGDPTARPAVSLQAALGGLYARAKRRPPRSLAKSAGDVETQCGTKFAEALSALLVQCSVSMDWRDVAFGNGPAKLFALATAPETENADPKEAKTTFAEWRSFDAAWLLAGAHDVVLKLQSLPTPEGPRSRTPIEIETPYGAVVVGGAGPDTYEPKRYLLIVDSGGDDVYLGGGRTNDPENPISLVLDLDGDDRYVSHPELAKGGVAHWSGRKGHRTAGPAGAVCGIAAIVDRQGNDLYRSASPGIASARFGAAVLWDQGGQDVYDGYAECEGYGFFGVGALVDGGGDDAYDCFVNSQGYGGTLGSGILFDIQGNDRYTANDTVVDFPSPQSAQHNASCSQGAAFGRRADYLDGQSMGGGFGILCDLQGNDSYSSGVFGQGVGYWKAVGLLLDASGNDVYSGQWYVQGASAHFAVGGLFDGSGNDRYESFMNMSAGAGHDFSIGWLEDLSGNDVYRASTLSLGAANANGIGLFRDAEGNDTYQAPRVTMGWATDPGAGSSREFALSFGLFLDEAGDDVYKTEASHPMNGSSAVNWTRKNAPPHGGQMGIFWDR